MIEEKYRGFTITIVDRKVTIRNQCNYPVAVYAGSKIEFARKLVDGMLDR